MPTSLEAASHTLADDPTRIPEPMGGSNLMHGSQLGRSVGDALARVPDLIDRLWPSGHLVHVQLNERNRLCKAMPVGC